MVPEFGREAQAGAGAEGGGRDAGGDLIDVIFDISVVGDPASRSGLSRYGIEVALGLNKNPDLKVSYCAAGSLWADYWARQFLAAHPELSGAAMGADPGVKGLMDRSARLSKDGSRVSQVAAKGVNSWLSVKNLIRKPVASAALNRADIFHSSYAPISRFARRRKKLARILTVHDLIPLKFPDMVGEHSVKRFRRILDSIDRNDWVVTVSQHTRDDLCEILKFDPARVFVTPLAASPDEFRPCRDEQMLAEVRKKYRLGERPFALSLATMSPHKNMDFLVRSFGRLIRKQRDCDLNLVLAGGRGATSERIEKMMQDEPALKGRVIMTGYVQEEGLSALYSAAEMFAFPSLYEGFGLPVVEAMQCGAPVIVSNRSSLPEVVGTAGRLLDPTDEESWAAAMGEIAGNPTVRNGLAGKSIEQAGTFSWGACVEKTVAAYGAAVRSSV